MDNAIYASLTRQSGLMREMRVVANNIANASTPGYRREGVIFAEHLASIDRRGDTLSMANARGRLLDLGQGGLDPDRTTVSTWRSKARASSSSRPLRAPA